MEESATVVRGPGVVAGLAALARNSLGLLVARFELAALELSEARNHALELLTVFALAVVTGWFALACATAAIVVLSWAALGWKILFLLFVLFLALTLGLVLKVRAMLREGKLTLPETMNELRNDREMLL